MALQIDKVSPSDPVSYYRARYYDPQTGRFTREDPLGYDGGDINLYRYVWNDSSNSLDPTGEWGVGVSLGGSGEGGLGAGVAATGSVGGGVFVNGWKPSVGGFASGGAFIGGPGTMGSNAAPSEPGKSNWVYGGFLGGGLNLFATNAKSVCDLAGPFRTYSFNLGAGVRVLSLQYSVGKNSAGETIRMLSYGGPIPGVSAPTGAGWGGSVSGYNTNTATTGDCGCH